MIFPAVGRNGKAMGKLPPGDAAVTRRFKVGQEG